MTTQAPIRVLSISRLVDTKRIDTLIRAIGMLAAEDRHARLDIIGDGPDRARLAALVDQLALSESVALHGHRTDIARWLAGADIFASASLYEGEPNAVLEAAAGEVPLVLSDIAEHREVARGGALYASGSDPRDFANALSDTAGDWTAAGERAAEARARVEERTPHRIAAEHLAAYCELLRG